MKICETLLKFKKWVFSLCALEHDENISNKLYQSVWCLCYVAISQKLKCCLKYKIPFYRWLQIRFLRFYCTAIRGFPLQSFTMFRLQIDIINHFVYKWKSHPLICDLCYWPRIWFDSALCTISIEWCQVHVFNTHL